MLNLEEHNITKESKGKKDIVTDAQEKELRKKSPRLAILEINIESKEDKDLTFKKIISKKYNIKEETSDSDVFIKYVNEFYKELDKKEFEQGEKENKKVISVKSSKETGLIKNNIQIKPNEKDLNDKLVIHSQKNILEGIIIGGIYGRKRNARQLKNKYTKKVVDRNDVITDDYYMLLYLPMDDNKGFLFLQYYPDISIKNELSTFISKTLRNRRDPYKININYYYDDEFNKQFSENSILDHITLSSNFIDGDDIGNQETEKEVPQKYIRLKIEISAINEKVKTSAIPSFFKKIGNIKSNKKELKDYPYKTATVKDSLKQTTFDIDEDLKIKPIIYLYENIDVSEEGIPNFFQLKDFCLKKLEDIKKEILPGYGNVTTV